MASKKKAPKKPISAKEILSDFLRLAATAAPQVSAAVGGMTSARVQDERSRMAFAIYINRNSTPGFPLHSELESCAQLCFHAADAFIKVRDEQAKPQSMPPPNIPPSPQ